MDGSKFPGVLLSDVDMNAGSPADGRSVSDALITNQPVSDACNLMP